ARHRRAPLPAGPRRPGRGGRGPLRRPGRRGATPLGPLPADPRGGHRRVRGGGRPRRPDVPALQGPAGLSGMAFDADDRDDLKRKFRAYAETPDTTLRDELITAHIGLAEYLARRFTNRGEPLDDLVQVASLGLLKAVDRFDPDRGLEFSTYATPTI